MPAHAASRSVGCVLARTQEEHKRRVGASTHPTCFPTKPRRRGLLCVVVIVLVAAAGLAGLGVAASQDQGWSPGEVSVAVRGKVVDDNGPVADARVGVKGDSHRVRTDGAGVFELPVNPSCEVRLVASKPGYYISGGDLPKSGPATIRLEPHPADDCPSYRWVASDPNPDKPDQCGNCHEQFHPYTSLTIYPQFFHIFNHLLLDERRSLSAPLSQISPTFFKKTFAL